MICSLGSFCLSTYWSSYLDTNYNVDGGGWEFPLSPTGGVFLAGIVNYALYPIDFWLTSKDSALTFLLNFESFFASLERCVDKVGFGLALTKFWIASAFCAEGFFTEICDTLSFFIDFLTKLGCGGILRFDSFEDNA